jgi:hypothetical protein
MRPLHLIENVGVTGFEYTDAEPVNLGTVLRRSRFFWAALAFAAGIAIGVYVA